MSWDSSAELRGDLSSPRISASGDLTGEIAPSDNAHGYEFIKVPSFQRAT